MSKGRFAILNMRHSGDGYFVARVATQKEAEETLKQLHEEYPNDYENAIVVQLISQVRSLSRLYKDVHIEAEV